VRGGIVLFVAVITATKEILIILERHHLKRKGNSMNINISTGKWLPLFAILFFVATVCPAYAEE
jgi:hypothetical protein